MPFQTLASNELSLGDITNQIGGKGYMAVTDANAGEALKKILSVLQAMNIQMQLITDEEIEVE